jgi:phenylacetate-coenzyme A ligase PaaK-like adenylate-forming protein
LHALVEHARRASRVYAEHYRAVPSGPIRLEELDRLPAVTKPELMARFYDWVTDPDATRARVEGFVANLGNLGQDFLGRYVVCTTSGSTGVPALLVQDHRAVAVMTGLACLRASSQRIEPEIGGTDADPGTTAGRRLCSRQGRLHLNSDWFLTEPIDAAGQPVPPGSRSDGSW